MSESTEDTITRAELLLAMRKSIEELITDILDGVIDDSTAYVTEIGAEFVKYLSKAADKDLSAERNIAHLKAQALVIAAKRNLGLLRETTDKIRLILGKAAVFAAKTLVAAAF